MKAGEKITIQVGFKRAGMGHDGGSMLAGQEVSLEKRANSLVIEARNLTEKHTFEISDSDLRELIGFLNRAAGEA